MQRETRPGCLSRLSLSGNVLDKARRKSIRSGIRKSLLGTWISKVAWRKSPWLFRPASPVVAVEKKAKRAAMDPEAFRQLGHQLIDWIADYRARVADFPVMARVEPGEIRAQLPETPPESPESFEAILQDL